jgi:hypothetical protein
MLALAGFVPPGNLSQRTGRPIAPIPSLYEAYEWGKFPRERNHTP